MRRAAVAFFVVLAVSAVAGPTRRAAAHAGLESSLPAASSVLEQAPDNIVLDFDEPIEASTASIVLFDQSGGEVALGAVEGATGDTSIALAAMPDLAAGTYAVVWRVTSIDGHVIDGAFSFRIGTGTGSGADADALLAQVRSGTTSDPVIGRLAGMWRLLGFVGLVMLVGSGLLLLTAGEVISAAPVRRFLVVAWTVLAAGTAASFALHGALSVGGGLGDAFSPSTWALIDGTQTGRALLVRLLVVVVLGGALVLHRFRGSGWWRATTIAAGVALLVTYPAAGHAASRTPATLWMAVDVVHLGGVVLWLGGVALAAVGGRVWLRDPAGEPVVRRFSRIATVAVPVIVATGVVQAIELSGGWNELTDTTWGRVLFVKVAAVVVLVVLGGASRWLLHHVGAAPLRRTVMVEAVLGIVVLGLAAALVSLPPQAAAQSRVFSATLTQAGLIADVTVTPGRVGSNDVHIVITPSGGSLQPVAAVTGRISLPSRDLPAAPITIVRDGANHYTGTITLAFSGDWDMDLIVEVAPGSTLLLSTVVPIP